MNTEYVTEQEYDSLKDNLPTSGYLGMGVGFYDVNHNPVEVQPQNGYLKVANYYGYAIMRIRDGAITLLITED